MKRSNGSNATSEPKECQLSVRDGRVSSDHVPSRTTIIFAFQQSQRLFWDKSCKGNENTALKLRDGTKSGIIMRQLRSYG